MFKKYLHIWITFTSIAIFFFGWAFLAQADRQAAALGAQTTVAQVALIFPPIPTLENIVETNLSGSGTAQILRINPATLTPVPQIQAPRVIVVRKIRTGGS